MFFKTLFMRPDRLLLLEENLPFLDLLRVIASTLIVWHHLAFYGPLSDLIYPVVPGLIDWLIEYGRMAVQIFLLIGGLCAARSLGRCQVLNPQAIKDRIVQRYQRIGLPYLAALAMAIAANYVAAQFMDHSSISRPPTWMQLLAHASFLQGLLGYESLSAGIWYLAIDFQINLLVLFVTAGAFGVSHLTNKTVKMSGFVIQQIIFWILAVSSLFVFNCNANWDDWALYFFGSFFLGMLLEATFSAKVPRILFWGYLALIGLANIHVWRPRLIVTAATALAIYAAARTGLLVRWPRHRAIQYLSRISFSLFLVHFPTCLVVNALWGHLFEDSALGSLMGMIAAYLLSLVVAIGFHHMLEARCLPQRTKQARASIICNRAQICATPKSHPRR
jgi:peptidoglycan/LPS O-acetylase OafA/YrhL